MSKDFNREPCFWTSTSPGYNTQDRQRTLMRDGKMVTERFPQRGHAGDYEDRRVASGTRYLRLIDHHGFEIYHCLTNAAAHLDHTAPYGQYAMAKARHLGWYMPGACPCALLTTGELTQDHLVSEDVRRGTPCAPGSYSYERPCPHSKAERAARAAQNKAIQDAREVTMKDSSTKHLEATQALTERLVETLTANDRAPVKAKPESKAEK